MKLTLPPFHKEPDVRDPVPFKENWSKPGTPPNSSGSVRSGEGKFHVSMLVFLIEPKGVPQIKRTH